MQPYTRLPAPEATHARIAALATSWPRWHAKVTSEYLKRPLGRRESIDTYVVRPVLGDLNDWDRALPHPFGGAYTLYGETPLCAVLEMQGIPGAVLSVEPEGKGLDVVQMQGVAWKDGKRRNCWELEPIDWRRYFVDLTEELAGRFGFEHVGVRSAFDNRWVDPLVPLGAFGERHLSVVDAYNIYDATADRLQFDENGKRWRKKAEKRGLLR